MRAKGTSGASPSRFFKGGCVRLSSATKDCKAQLLCSDVMHAAAVGGQFG